MVIIYIYIYIYSFSNKEKLTELLTRWQTLIIEIKVRRVRRGQ